MTIRPIFGKLKIQTNVLMWLSQQKTQGTIKIAKESIMDVQNLSNEVEERHNRSQE